MIRYLAEDEKTKSRALWREAFPEDSESFDDYYYTEKIRDNQILVMEEDGKIISMLHLNPYQIAIQKQIRKSAYIVGVATTKEKRREGHMRAILTQA
ncbi:MAG: GNAT family N-acetyltransferase, partial [Hungatella sp.]